MTSYNGQTITYDTIGNPLTDGTWTYTWEHGRELASMTDGTTTWMYAYDANGMRTERSNGTTTYEYVYNSSQLVQMTVGADTLYFTPDTVTYNDTTYYYVTNLQGDVTAIINSSGAFVAIYTYDAWGNILTIDGTMANTLGTLNPIRYRGYVYDQETGLYYLQSRYYDPEMGRFINADALVSTGQGLLGNNMFAYCNNNPVVRVDHNGHASLSEWWEEFLRDAKEWLEEEKEEASSNDDRTTTVGLTGCGALGFGGSVSMGVTFDTKGNVGGALTVNGGGGLPSLGAGGYASINNAPTIFHQEGLGTAVGASGGPGVIAVGGDYNILIDDTNGCVYQGGTVSVTYGLYPTFVEAHGEAGYTWVKGFNIYDAAIGVVEFLQSL